MRATGIVKYFALLLAGFLALQLYFLATSEAGPAPQDIHKLRDKPEGYHEQFERSYTKIDEDGSELDQQLNIAEKTILPRRKPQDELMVENTRNEEHVATRNANNKTTTISNVTYKNLSRGSNDSDHRKINDFATDSIRERTNSSQQADGTKNEASDGLKNVKGNAAFMDIAGEILGPRVRRKIHNKLGGRPKHVPPNGKMPLSDDYVYTYNENKYDPVTVKTLGNYTKSCSVISSTNSVKPHVPFKIYVYDLPAAWNSDLIKCLESYTCFNTDHCGMGPYIASNAELNIYNTWQFSLEVILHHKFLASPYRTLNASEADLFYIPYYGAASCFCHRSSQPARITEDLESLSAFLQNFSSYREGKPHVMAISKIEREQDGRSCPTLSYTRQKHLLFLGIEAREAVSRRTKIENRLTVVPYPSYAHLNEAKLGAYVTSLQNRTRPVFAFLAAGTRRSNTFRAHILDQFQQSRTKYPMPKHYSHFRVPSNATITKLWLTTPECTGTHHEHTLQWMSNAIFCIQPPGDSPTRKSFFDAVASGCIPVIFKRPSARIYPFTSSIDYDKFTVTIPHHRVENGDSVVRILQGIDRHTIQDMQAYLQTVIKYFQYSFPITDFTHNDAVVKILEEIQTIFSIQSRS